MTRDQQAAEVIATLRRCAASLDGQHVLSLVNPFQPQSERNQVLCIRCYLRGDDL